MVAVGPRQIPPVSCTFLSNRSPSPLWTQSKNGPTTNKFPKVCNVIQTNDHKLKHTHTSTHIHNILSVKIKLFHRLAYLSKMTIMATVVLLATDSHHQHATLSTLHDNAEGIVQRF